MQSIPFELYNASFPQYQPVGLTFPPLAVADSYPVQFSIRFQPYGSPGWTATTIVCPYGEIPRSFFPMQRGRYQVFLNANIDGAILNYKTLIFPVI